MATPAPTRLTVDTQNGPVDVDSISIPAISLTALRLLLERQQRETLELVTLVASDLGLSGQDNWQVDISSGAFIRPARTDDA